MILGLLLCAAVLHPATASGQCTATDWSKINASDAASNNFFGASVSISGDVLIVGAPLGDDACVADPNCDSG